MKNGNGERPFRGHKDDRDNDHVTYVLQVSLRLQFSQAKYIDLVRKNDKNEYQFDSLPTDTR